MSSVFKSRSFQSKNCASSPFLHSPPNLLHPDPVLDVSLKHCTLFFFFFRRRRMAPKHLAGILGETRTLREPSSFCAPKAPSCK